MPESQLSYEDLIKKTLENIYALIISYPNDEHVLDAVSKALLHVFKQIHSDDAIRMAGDLVNKLEADAPDVSKDEYLDLWERLVVDELALKNSHFNPLKTALDIVKNKAENRGRYVNNGRFGFYAALEERALKVYPVLVQLCGQKYGTIKTLAYSYGVASESVYGSQMEKIAAKDCHTMIEIVYGEGKIDTALEYARLLADGRHDHKSMPYIEGKYRTNIVQSSSADLWGALLDKAAKNNPEALCKDLNSAVLSLMPESGFKRFNGDAFNNKLLEKLAQYAPLYEDQSEVAHHLYYICHRLRVDNVPYRANEKVFEALLECSKKLRTQGELLSAVKAARSSQYFAGIYKEHRPEMHIKASHLIVNIAQDYLEKIKESKINYGIDEVVWALSCAHFELPEADIMKKKAKKLHEIYLNIKSNGNNVSYTDLSI